MKSAAGGNPSPAAQSLPPPVPIPTHLSRFIARGEAVQLPLIGAAWIELLGAWASNAVESEVARAIAALELTSATREAMQAELERAVRTLARTVRDPEDHAKPLGTVDEWGALDPDVVSACWQTYGDVRERLDPLASIDLTPDERLAVQVAIKKKDANLLRSFGIAKLSAYLLSTDVPPPSSPEPSSPTLPSSPEA